MSKILLITVGGSPQPILTAIETLQPDRVIFICSGGSKGSISQVIGEGTPCEIRQGTEVVERLPNIPTQVGLGDRFQRDRDIIPIQDPDDLSECYKQVFSTIQTLRNESPTAQIMADYTGGTKTMSVGLASACLDQQVTLYLTTGNRTNTIRIERGELTGQVTTAHIIAQRTLEQVLPSALHQYNYSAAISQIKNLLRTVALPIAYQRKLQQVSDCCLGFDAWDRFDHQTAWEFLEGNMNRSEIQPLGLFLKRVISSRAQIDDNFDGSNGSRGHGYEIVQDLILNAQRRVKQERYDDAVGRLYRALELLAQIRLLQQYGIQTGDVDLEKIPESLQQEYKALRSPRNNKVQLSLIKSYELLTQFPDEPLGKVYKNRKNYLLNALEKRNNSLFAHGFEPIYQTDYEQVSDAFINFMKEGITQITEANVQSQAPQFPTSLDFS